MNILILEDNPGDADLIKEYLLDATDLFVNTDCRAYLSESLEPIGEGRYDIVLLDLGLPDSQGLNTLEKVLEVRGEQIVIVLTGMSDIEVGVEALKIGAVDYLFKGMMSSSLLVKSIMFSLERFKERGYLRFVKDIF